jgi:hypothetical protein
MSELSKQTCKKQLPDYTALHPENYSWKKTSLRVASESHIGHPSNFEFLGAENMSHN